MTYERDGELCVLVKRGLEGKQRKQVIRGQRHGIDPFATPRPHRRADVVNRTYALALEPTLEPQVEIRRIDADEQWRTGLSQTAEYVAADADKLGDARKDLDEPTQGELFQRVPQIASRARHARAADPRKTGLRDLCADSADELCAKRVTRGLAGDDADRDRRLGWNNPPARG
jgi:hypothetical protein